MTKNAFAAQKRMSVTYKWSMPSPMYRLDCKDNWYTDSPKGGEHLLLLKNSRSQLFTSPGRFVFKGAEHTLKTSLSIPALKWAPTAEIKITRAAVSRLIACIMSGNSFQNYSFILSKWFVRHSSITTTPWSLNCAFSVLLLFYIIDMKRSHYSDAQFLNVILLLLNLSVTL